MASAGHSRRTLPPSATVKGMGVSSAIIVPSDSTTWLIEVCDYESERPNPCPRCPDAHIREAIKVAISAAILIAVWVLIR